MRMWHRLTLSRGSDPFGALSRTCRDELASISTRNILDMVAQDRVFAARGSSVAAMALAHILAFQAASVLSLY